MNSTKLFTFIPGILVWIFHNIWPKVNHLLYY
uniref:Uncharacterized protein n=1 Tax=Anguilla anguilla TaxID=7936 RepID=A0A0E9VQV3_ANGAN